jgi:hypothetical protein
MDDAEVLGGAREAGFTSEQVIITYLPYPDEFLLGGTFIRVLETEE